MVDLLVVGGCNLARVPYRLRVLVGYPGEHRNIVLREPELLHHRDADILRKAVELLDPGFGRLERREAVNVDAEGLRDPGVALGRCRGVELADRAEDTGGQSAPNVAACAMFVRASRFPPSE